MATTARRSTSIGTFQAQQRGEMEALGDRDVSDHDVAAFDPLTGRIVAATEHAAQVMAQADRTVSVADELAALNVEASADTPLGEIVGRVRLAAGRAKIAAGEPEIRAEAERIWTAFGDSSSALFQEQTADEESGYDGPLVEPKPEDRADDPARPHEYSVAPDGTVSDWRQYAPRRATETDIDASPDDATADGPRFSGAGASEDDDLPFTEASKLIPSDASFQNRLFQPAPALANLAVGLISQHGFLDDLNACTIDYRWRRKGGGSKGKQKIGYLKRVSGELTIFTTANFILWLAADTARIANFTDRQIEAAVFHQLLHIGQDDKGNWIKLAHDFEGFGTEVTHYGAWTADLKIGSEAFTTAVQLGLDLDADDDEDEDDEDLDA